MNINNEVTYAPLDSERMVIPWVRVKSRDGAERIYRNTEMNVTDEQIQAVEHRRMDCIDCHNRPTHIYHQPAQSINHVMELGWIDRTLPYIKSTGVQALENHYSTRQVALDSIRTMVEEFYRSNYPQIAASKRAAIDKAIVELQTIYSRNYFPEMKHDWRQFPDHIGHMYSPGCFRCHDGKHQTDDGRVLSKDCNTCHTILSQQFEKETQRVSVAGLEYRHPVLLEHIIAFDDDATGAGVTPIAQLYRGRQDETVYRRLDDGGDENRAELEISRRQTMETGEFYPLLPPRDDIHFVNNVSEVPSISLHLLANDTACVWRHRFDPAAGTVKAFRSGYSNAPCPDETAP